MFSKIEQRSIQTAQESHLINCSSHIGVLNLENLLTKSISLIDEEVVHIVDYSQDDFRDFWRTESKCFLHRSECKILNEMLQPHSDWFIDLGCGHGRLLPAYYQSDRPIVMVDYAMNHLEMVSQNHDQDNLFFIAADAYALPFRDQVFGQGISIRLLHHMDSPSRFINEFSRIFRSNAHFIMTYMNKRNILRMLKYGKDCFRHDHQHISEMLYGTHPALFQDLIQKAGCDISYQRSSGFLHQITKNSHLLEKLVGQSKTIAFLGSSMDQMYNRVFGSIGLGLMQYALMRKRAQNKKSISAQKEYNSIMDILMCPSCSSTALLACDDVIQCLSCHRIYPKVNDIYDFRLQ